MPHTGAEVFVFVHRASAYISCSHYAVSVAPTDRVFEFP